MKRCNICERILDFGMLRCVCGSKDLRAATYHDLVNYGREEEPFEIEEEIASEVIDGLEAN